MLPNSQVSQLVYKPSQAWLGGDEGEEKGVLDPKCPRKAWLGETETSDLQAGLTLSQDPRNVMGQEAPQSPPCSGAWEEAC